MNRRSIYVAATSQHVGKTTSTLGLSVALQNAGFDLGYCKPVGQQAVDYGDLKADKDALLFSEVLDFPLEPPIHSPVILGKGATTAYLDNPADFPYAQAVEAAARELTRRHELVIFEGTGHPGVGSVVGLSNATVARMLDARVVMVVEGGIGNTIDRLHMATALFREQGVPIIGVIINKVLPEKMEKVRHYVGNWLTQKGLKLLGVLPFDKSLSYPIMATIKKATWGRTLIHDAYLTNKVEGIIAGSLVDSHDFTKEKNLLLVVSSKRVCSALQRIMQLCKIHQVKNFPLSGVIITGDGGYVYDQFEKLPCKQFLLDKKIPVISTPLDTYGSVLRISRIEVKINIHTPWKSQRAIELVDENVDLEPILREIEVEAG